MKTESNTYSAGAIMDYLPKFIHNVMEDLTILPEHEDTKYRGGVTFILTVNNVSVRYKVIHNFSDLFDIYATNIDGEYEVIETDLFFGEFMQLWDLWIENFGQYFEEE